MCADIAAGGPAGPALHSCWSTMLESLHPLKNTRGSFKWMDLLAGQILLVSGFVGFKKKLFGLFVFGCLFMCLFFDICELRFYL